MWGLGLVHYEVRLVLEFSSRLDEVVMGKCLDARPQWDLGDSGPVPTGNRLGLDQNHLWRKSHATIACG